MTEREIPFHLVKVSNRMVERLLESISQASYPQERAEHRQCALFVEGWQTTRMVVTGVAAGKDVT
jgi:hypothetical protein